MVPAVSTATNALGRLAADQPNEPVRTPEDFVIHVHRLRMPLLKKRRSNILFAFSAMVMSCNNRQGKVIKTDSIGINTPALNHQLPKKTDIIHAKTGEPTRPKPVRISRLKNIQMHGLLKEMLP